MNTLDSCYLMGWYKNRCVRHQWLQKKNVSLTLIQKSDTKHAFQNKIRVMERTFVC